MIEKETLAPLPLQDMILPSPPPWFPMAYGWWLVIALVVLCLCVCLLGVKKRQQQQKAKKALLKLMRPHHQALSPSETMALLRQGVLTYFPRKRVASLTGLNWYEFLDKCVGSPLFAPKQAQWDNALYGQSSGSNDAELIKDCIQWVENALPPKASFLKPFVATPSFDKSVAKVASEKPQTSNRMESSK